MIDTILRGDHHVHSTFSNDALSSLGDNVAAAVEAGLNTIRLVDHVRSSSDWVADYLAAVAKLRIPAELTVLTGVETKILDISGSLDIPALPSGIDRILIADHQFPGRSEPLSPNEVITRLDAGWSIDDALDDLVNALIHAMERHPGNQLAHCFSILPKVGLSEEQLGSERISAWAAAAAATDTLVEVNEKWGCPEAATLEALGRSGATLVASTDSHRAEDVGRYCRVAEILGAVSPRG